MLVDDEFQVQWRITDNKIDVELASLVKPGNYMAFGLSGSQNRTQMEGSDVTVAWMDEGSMSPMVADYNLQSKAQVYIWFAVIIIIRIIRIIITIFITRLLSKDTKRQVLLLQGVGRSLRYKT